MPNTVIFRRSAKGFTLIELMIVIAIIAILAGILVPNFVKARDKARFEASCETIKNIGTAVEMYAADNSGCYPASLNKLTPDYLKTIPTCPYTNRSYNYSFSVNPNSYSLLSRRVAGDSKTETDIYFSNGRLETGTYRH